MTAIVMPFRDNDAEPESAPEQGVRVWLGCNQRPRQGWVNVDLVPFPGVDVACDLEQPWPWATSSVDEVACADLPEHLRMWWDEPDPDLMERAEKESDPAIVVGLLMKAIRRPQRRFGIIHFMNEAYRVLKPNGRLDCLIPSTDGRGWSQDPTHVSYWNENSLLYFTDPAYMGLYPHLIKCKYRPLKVVTTVRNALDVSWIHFILEADKS